MPKLTVKQEGFAQSVALQRMTFSDAYRHNYDVNGDNEHTVNVNAARLARHTVIAPRIAELQADVLAMVALTPGLIKRQLDEDRAFAQAQDDSATALRATEATADLGGDLLGRRKHTVDSRSLSIDVAMDGLTVEELRGLSDLGRQARALRGKS